MTPSPSTPARTTPPEFTLGAYRDASSTLSQLIDIALARLIADESERRHVAGYIAQPPQQDEAEWAELDRDPSEVADDVDWAELYGTGTGR